jgi:hypothetical protein
MLLMRLLGEPGQIAPSEHSRLLLAAAAEAVSAEPGDTAARVATAPDALLRALDRLGRSGWDIMEEVPSELRPVVREYRRLIGQCGLRLAGELDRALLVRAAQSPPRTEPLLLVGFDGQHWPQVAAARCGSGRALPRRQFSCRRHVKRRINSTHFGWGPGSSTSAELCRWMNPNERGLLPICLAIRMQR